MKIKNDFREQIIFIIIIIVEKKVVGISLFFSRIKSRRKKQHYIKAVERETFSDMLRKSYTCCSAHFFYNKKKKERMKEKIGQIVQYLTQKLFEFFERNF